MGTADLDNALVNQKNTLLSALNDATDIDDLYNVIDLLDFAAPLWEACEYGYKVREIRQALRAKAAVMLESEQEELKGYRRNCHLWNITCGNIRKLEALSV